MTFDLGDRAWNVHRAYADAEHVGAGYRVRPRVRSGVVRDLNHVDEELLQANRVLSRSFCDKVGTPINN
jgi:hypothetical protein